MKTLVLILTVSLLCCLRAQDQISPPPLMTVSGYGFVNVQPDEVEVDITIVLRNQNVDTLTKLINNRFLAVITILHNSNVTDIESSKVSIYPYYSRSSGSFGNPLPSYYQGKKDMTFILRNISNYEALMTKLYDAGIDRVGSVIFQLSNDLLRAKELEAQKNAADNLKEVVDTLAESLGLDVGDAFTISEYTYGGDPQSYYGSSRGARYAIVQAGEVVFGSEDTDSYPGSSSQPTFLPDDFIITCVIEAKYVLV